MHFKQVRIIFKAHATTLIECKKLLNKIDSPLMPLIVIHSAKTLLYSKSVNRTITLQPKDTIRINT